MYVYELMAALADKPAGATVDVSGIMSVEKLKENETCDTGSDVPEYTYRQKACEVVADTEKRITIYTEVER